MEKLPVYVGYRQLGNGEVDLRASLRFEMVDIAGYTVAEVNETTEFAPPNHQFLVVRSLNSAAIVTINALVAQKLVDWRFYEQKEAEDTSTYALFVMTTRAKEGDVKYLDLGR